jgi:hypothetical protein
MSDETQDQTLNLEMPCIESGWEKPVTPATSILRPPGMLPRPAAQFVARSESRAPAAKSNG